MIHVLSSVLHKYLNISRSRNAGYHIDYYAEISKTDLLNKYTMLFKNQKYLKPTLRGSYIYTWVYFYSKYSGKLCSLEFPFHTDPIKSDFTDFQHVP